MPKTIQQIPAGWKVVKVIDLVGSIVGGGTPSRNNPEYWDGDIP